MKKLVLQKFRNRAIAKVLGTALPVAAMLCAAVSAHGQISVVAGGSTTDAFNELPPATSWSRGNITGGAGDVESADALDASVQLVGVSEITTALESNTGNPPGTSANARWSSSGFYIQTRPTGNLATLMMATLRNDTVGAINEISVNYDYVQRLTSAANPELIPGHRVYYSLTGAAGEWVPVGNFGNRDPVGGVQPQSIQINLSATPWAAGSTMYILFADDNSGPNDDYANGIDNFQITFGPPEAPVIVTQPVNRTVDERGTVSFSVTATGTSLGFHWLSNDIPVNVSGNTLTINSASVEANNSTYRVIVSNSVNQVTSSTATLTVVPDTTLPFVRAVYATNLTTVVIVFNEPVVAGEPGLEWWPGVFIENVDPIAGDAYFAVDATFSGNTVLIHHGTERHPNADYMVYIAGAIDTAATPNTMEDAAVALQQFVPTPAIGLTPENIWRYLQISADVADGWQNPGFDDSTWSEGPNGMAGPTTESNTRDYTIYNQAAFLAPATGGHQALIRGHFTHNGTNTTGVLQVGAVIDDGAVFFLNGVEIGRLRMLAGPVNYNLFATGAETEPIAGNDLYFVVTNLVQGDNVFAVLVANNNLTSSDFQFAVTVTPSVATLPTGLSITDQPTGGMIQERGEITLIVSATGEQPITYQWLHDGGDIPGATSPTYRITNALPSQAGAYRVRVINPAEPGGILSDVANVVVQADIARPTLVASLSSVTGTEITLSFSEAVAQATAETAGNFVVTQVGGGTITVSSAVLTNGTNVVLTLASPLSSAQTYRVTVNNVTDLAETPNAIVAGSGIDVCQTTELIGINETHVWRYDDTATDLGTAWRAPGFNDAAWKTGFPVFDIVNTGSRVGTEVGGLLVRTALSYTNDAGTNVITTYFRTHFTIPGASADGVELRLRRMVDDGAVFYLNGQEIHRFNITNEVVQYGDFANTTGGQTLSGSISVPSTALVPGDNVLAVEVHQQSLTSSDITFAAELIAVICPGGAEPAPRVNIGRAGSQIVVSWDAPGYCLQETTALTASTVWTASSVVSGVPFTPAGDRFYRLIQCP